MLAALFAEAEFKRRGPTKSSYRKIGKEIIAEFVSSPSAFLKSIIGIHLGYKFGVKPVAKSVNDVMSALGRVDKALERLRKPQVVHGSYTYDKPEYYVSPVQVEPSTFGFYSTKVTMSRTTRVTWTESALRQIDLNKLPSINTLRLTALQEALGLKPGLSTVWSAIPRSFILDWFFPISDFLEQADGVKPSDTWFTTLNTYGSIKTRTSGYLREEFAPLIASNTSVSLAAGLETNRMDFNHTTFTRTALNGPTWSPTQIFVPEPRVPSMAQWALIAEMSLQTLLSRSYVTSPTMQLTQ
jgi:hypothetical protein